MLGHPTPMRRVVHTAGAAGSAPMPNRGEVPIPAPATVGHSASDLLLPAQVADRLSVSTKVLERWRGAGDGPAFVRLTRKTLRYRASDVEAFVTAKVRASTASV